MKQLNINIELTIKPKSKSQYEAIAEIKDGNITHRYVGSSGRESLAVKYVLEQIAEDSTLVSLLVHPPQSIFYDVEGVVTR